MKLLNHLFVQNQQWADRIKAEDPHFFEKLSAQQAPEYLWIGCSDSRVPANELLGLLPGDVSRAKRILVPYMTAPSKLEALNLVSCASTSRSGSATKPA